MTTVAIGDIHGMYDMLEQLLGKIDAFSRREPKLGSLKLIFLGDYIDRGPDSRQVVRRLRVLEGPSVICLRGNHEQMMIDCQKEPEDWQNFLLNGGDQTLESYKHYEEMGTNKQFGYSSPEDLLRSYPKFFWATTYPYIQAGLNYLDCTAAGRQWTANLFRHVFSSEHKEDLIR